MTSWARTYSIVLQTSVSHEALLRMNWSQTGDTEMYVCTSVCVCRELESDEVRNNLGPSGSARGDCDQTLSFSYSSDEWTTLTGIPSFNLSPILSTLTTSRRLISEPICIQGRSRSLLHLSAFISFLLNRVAHP